MARQGLGEIAVNPAPSVIVFTVLSGAGFGLMGLLALGAPAPGWPAFAHWALAYGLATGGLIASTFHLGRPERAWRAFTQWRTSWLSREAWAATVTLLILAPVALCHIFGWSVPRALAWPGAAMCAITTLCTAMIYAQIAAVPRWNNWITPALFVMFGVTGGLILTANPWSPVAAAMVGMTLIAAFTIGDTLFAGRGQTTGTATGLGGIGPTTVFEQPHTGGNYLMREMMFVVGRRHARNLRIIAVVCAALIPAVILTLSLSWHAISAAAIIHLTGAFAARWLFFAEAEHVVGLYYGHH
jgi:sulfite dehydrogenase (quinone) subunit SoeC